MNDGNGNKKKASWECTVTLTRTFHSVLVNLELMNIFFDIFPAIPSNVQLYASPFCCSEAPSCQL
jgi:hypothetical protein